MKKGDTVEITGGDYHFFREGDVVQFTGEFLFGFPRFKNSTGTVQTVREEDFNVIPTFEAVAVFDDELDKVIAEIESKIPRREHQPRETNFTLNVTEEAIKDEILLITYLYHGGSLSLREIGSLLSVDEATIRRRMKKHNVPTRTVSQALRAKYSL